MFENVSAGLPPLPFRLLQLRAGPHENFHYVVGDPATGEAAAVDPAFELERLFGAAVAAGLEVRTAWFTHGHWDHIGGVPEIAEHDVQEIVLHEAAAGHAKVQEAEAAGLRVRLAKDGDRFDLGSLRAELLHTPGHQPEGSCFLVGDAAPGQQVLLGGDTLFVDSCGRTDFPGGDTDAMFASMDLLRQLPGATVVLPGHDYADRAWDTLASQVERNPALATRERGAFGELYCLTH
ncbi:MAG: MBL fold metallo-hydrolase [Thermoplasmatota archaeon]